MNKEKDVDKHGKFYGIATIGERGQIVIPSDARKALATKKGERFFVFGMDNKAVAFIKVEHAKKLLESLEKKSKSIKTMLQKMV